MHILYELTELENPTKQFTYSSGMQITTDNYKTIAAAGLRAVQHARQIVIDCSKFTLDSLETELKIDKFVDVYDVKILTPNGSVLIPNLKKEYYSFKIKQSDAILSSKINVTFEFRGIPNAHLSDVFKFSKLYVSSMSWYDASETSLKPGDFPFKYSTEHIDYSIGKTLQVTCTRGTNFYFKLDNGMVNYKTYGPYIADEDQQKINVFIG